MIVAGLGCRRGTSADGIGAALALACSEAGIDLASVDALATGIIKEDEPGMRQLATRLGLPLHIVCDTALQDVAEQTRTVSRHSLAKASSPSLSEAAALAGVGGPAELLVARVVAAGATCALARSRSAP